MVVMCSQGWKPVIREIFLSPLKQELLGQLDFIFPYRTLKFINSLFSICRENVENHSLSNMFFPITLQFVQSSLILKIKPNQLTDQPTKEPTRQKCYISLSQFYVSTWLGCGTQLFTQTLLEALLWWYRACLRDTEGSFLDNCNKDRCNLFAGGGSCHQFVKYATSLKHNKMKCNATRYAYILQR